MRMIMEDIKCPCGLRGHMESEDCDKTNCNDCCPLARPQTNADSIRAMNDEDLAKWLAHTVADTVWDSLGKKGVPFSRVCAVPEYYYQFLNWLKQPAEGERKGYEG